MVVPDDGENRLWYWRKLVFRPYHKSGLVSDRAIALGHVGQACGMDDKSLAHGGN
jgi:hypothetical protein